MLFSELFSKEMIHIDDQSLSKTAVLLKISQLLSQKEPKLDEEELFTAYWNRENLGSTAIGHGVTIPHLRMKNINKPLACFLKLRNPVDFGAEDKQPVDLVIGLLVPEDQTKQHLELLATIVEQFNRIKFREACRSAKDEAALGKIFANPDSLVN